MPDHKEQRIAFDRAVDALNELNELPSVDHCVRVGHKMVGRARIIEAREFIAELAHALWLEEDK